MSMTPVPPVQATPTPRQAGKVWPTVIGTLAIVFGAGGLLAYGCLGVLVSVFMGVIARVFREAAEKNPQMEMQAAQFEVMAESVWMMLTSNLVAGGLAVVLLVGGLGVTGRKGYGVRWCMTWAGLKFLYAIPAAMLGYYMSAEQFKRMQEATVDSGNQVPAGIFTLMQSMGVVGVVLQVLWLWAGPVFLLIWFARRSVKDEVRSWGGEGSG
ncbi:MAG: hypothetical protein ACYTGC_11595 [Planctomycetota bacterium]|jgi:hypothetical protein